MNLLPCVEVEPRGAANATVIWMNPAVAELRDGSEVLAVSGGRLHARDRADDRRLKAAMRMPMISTLCAMIRASAWRWASCRDRARDLPANRR